VESSAFSTAALHCLASLASSRALKRCEPRAASQAKAIMAEDGHAEERAKLRALAMGPCKQACLLLGDMSFAAFKAQLKANADEAGLKARTAFYESEKLKRLDDTAHANASASFEAQLGQQLDAQLAKHAQAAQDWGMATVTRCMEGCVGLRDPAKVQELCDCIEFSSDLPAASKCFDASVGGGS
jgi:hypothetical protein